MEQAAQKTKLLFIINPVSGVGKQGQVNAGIDNYLDCNKFDYEIIYTQYAGHASEICRESHLQYDAIIAVGGDGTVNEISQGLIGTQTVMGIIPVGSGNGLARYLQIPLNVIKAISIINQFNVKTIDTIKINDRKCVNVAGVGFDAQISHKFATYGKRGLIGYLKLIGKEFMTYKARKYHIMIDGQEFKKRAFLITVANSSQFGFNAHISPQSQIDDGWLEICFLKRFPMVMAPFIGIRLFNKTMDQSKYTTFMKGKQITIWKKRKDLVAHVDGEPVHFGNRIEIEIQPLSLKVITPPAS